MILYCNLSGGLSPCSPYACTTGLLRRRDGFIWAEINIKWWPSSISPFVHSSNSSPESKAVVNYARKGSHQSREEERCVSRCWLMDGEVIAPRGVCVIYCQLLVSCCLSDYSECMDKQLPLWFPSTISNICTKINANWIWLAPKKSNCHQDSQSTTQVQIESYQCKLKFQGLLENIVQTLIQWQAKATAWQVFKKFWFTLPESEHWSVSRAVQKQKQTINANYHYLFNLYFFQANPTEITDFFCNKGLDLEAA